MDKNEERIKILEKKLEKSEKLISQFKLLLDSIPDLVFMKDENLLWLYGNPAILDFYQMNSNNYIGKEGYETLPEEYAKSCIKSDKKVKEEKTISKLEEKTIDENGNLDYYEVFKVPSFENNQFKGLIGIGRNITKAKETQEKLELAIKKQKSLNQDLKMAMMGEMIENIIHQWVQPLSGISSINSSTKFLLESGVEILKKDLIRNTTDIQIYITHMNETLKTFKEFFKEDKEKQNFYMEEIVESAVKISQGFVKRHGISIDISFRVDHRFFGYKNELIHVFLNLLNNSKDAFLENKIRNAEIKINSTINDDFMIVKFLDNAMGIPEDIIDRIFDPHFSTKDKSGSGIGLYMSSNIIKDSFNGELSVHNQNNGACFEIKIPLSTSILAF